MPDKQPTSMQEVLVLPDNVLINSGKVLYQPSYIAELMMVPVVLYRVSKVAKCVREQYIGRYYQRERVGLAYHASALAEGEPEYLRYLFDGSLVRSEVLTEAEQMGGLQLQHYHQLEEQAIYHFTVPDIEEVGPVISMISHYFLLKLGDLIAVPLWEEPIVAKPKDAFLLSRETQVEEGKELIFSQVE